MDVAAFHQKCSVEISRSIDATNPWSTVAVRRGQHLLFSASHRDVVTAFVAYFDGEEMVCVFHGDALQDEKGRFFLGYKPTVCTTYNVRSVQSVSLVLHHVAPRHVVPGVSGVYVFGDRMGVARPPFSGSEHVALACDAWYMSSPLALQPIFLPLPDGVSPGTAPQNQCFLQARLLGEWTAGSSRGGSRLVLAVTADGMARVARVSSTVLGDREGLTWRWVTSPGSAPFPLSVEGQVVVSVADGSEKLDRQVIFVYSEASQRIVVYRVPHIPPTEDVAAASDPRLVLEELAQMSTTCAALGSLQLFPEFMVQPMLVVRGWEVDLYCPFTISHATDGGAASRPVACLHLASLDMREGIVEVLSVARPAFLRAVVAPSMEVRCVGLPHLGLSSNPHIGLVLHTISLLQHAAPRDVGSAAKVYGLVHLLIKGLWRCVNDGKPASFWSSWHALAEHLKRIFIRASATDECFAKYCDEVAKHQPPTDSPVLDIGRQQRTTQQQRAIAASYVDPLFISSDSIDDAASDSSSFKKFLWTFDSTPTQESGGTSSTIPPVEHDPPDFHQWTRADCCVVALGLHALFESQKLQRSSWGALSRLGGLLAELFAVLSLQQYVRYHTTVLCISEASTPVLRAFDANADWPSTRELEDVFGSSTQEIVRVDTPFDIHHILNQLIQGSDVAYRRWPQLGAAGFPPEHPIAVASVVLQMYHATFCVERHRGAQFSDRWWLALTERVAGAAKSAVISHAFLRDVLAPGVAQPILRALQIAKTRAEDTWPDETFALVGRTDKLRAAHPLVSQRICESELVRLSVQRSTGKLYSVNLVDDDGVSLDTDFAKLWGDTRLELVQSIMNTASPIPLPGRGDGSEAVHASLRALTRRVLALPLGRGMLTLATRNFRVRDVIPVPLLTLEGRTSDGIIINNDLPATHPEALLWPTVHNGCAAGLRFLPLGHGKGNGWANGGGGDGSVGEGRLGTTTTSTTAEGGTSSSAASAPTPPLLSRHWVVYQTRGSHMLPAKAGILYAAGLLGHLSSLQLTDIYSLLASTQAHANHNVARDPTTLAVILGLGCSFRGTHHDVVFRCLSVHLQSLTPTNADLDVSIEVQTGALVAIGLLCEGSEDSFLIDVLLSEMARLPSDEHTKHRKGYALAAGIALGLILLGKGRRGVAGIDDRLLSFMTGARRESQRHRLDGEAEFDERVLDEGHFLTRSLLHRVASPPIQQCNRILESAYYNVNVSGSGAIMALGLIYLKSNDTMLASKLLPPDTVISLQAVFPEHCLLRTCLGCLVCWDSVEATREYVYSKVPSTLQDLATHKGHYRGLSASQVRFLLMNMGHVIAGAVFALGLRFVGSMSADAKHTILAELKGFLAGNIGTSGVAMDPIQKKTGAFDACVSSCAVALSLVMAGTGDTQCFQILRKMLKRLSANFGMHMAGSMALGVLFLGGGKLTLSNSTPSIAALLISFFPTWPKDFSDNSVHLQMFRHFYVLAVESRMLQTIDAETGEPVAVHVRLSLNKQRVQVEDASPSANRLWTPVPRGVENVPTVNVTAPCLLPDLTTITTIEIRSSAHYPLVVRSDSRFGGGFGGDGLPSSLTVRVLAKNARVASAAASYDIFEDFVRLLHHQVTGPCAAFVLLDNLRLLFTSVDIPLATDGGGSVACTTTSAVHSTAMPSHDTVLNVKYVLERMYGNLFASKRDPRTDHVVRGVVLDRLSPSDIVRSVSLPSLSSVHEGSSSAGADAPSSFDAAPFESLPPACNVLVWFTQALHFYGLALNASESAPQLLEFVEEMCCHRRSTASQSLPLDPRVPALVFCSNHIDVPFNVLQRVIAVCRQ